MRATEFITEAVLDPEGWGSTPYGKDIDYFGLRVKMKPSMFLSLSTPLTSGNINPNIEKHMKAGGKIAYPMLDIDIPDEWSEGNFSKPAKVTGHEGRNRMTAWIKLKGDEPIQVNIKPRYLRRRSITPEMIEALSKGIIGQRGNFIENPFDASTALEEGLKDIVAGTAMALGALGMNPAMAKVQQQPQTQAQSPTKAQQLKHQTPAQQKEFDKLIQQVGKSQPTIDKKKAELTKTPTQAVNQQSIDSSKLKESEKKLYDIAKSNNIKGQELAQFLAQMKHESLNFKKMNEIPDKDDPTFKKYDPKYSPAKAAELGNIKPGDGELFKGRGYIQLTGRDNYQRAGKALKLPLEENPKLAADPDIAAKIAVWYWKTRVKPYINDFSDTTSVTKKINSGLLGLAERDKFFKNYLERMKTRKA